MTRPAYGKGYKGQNNNLPTNIIYPDITEGIVGRTMGLNDKMNDWYTPFKQGLGYSPEPETIETRADETGDIEIDATGNKSDKNINKSNFKRSIKINPKIGDARDNTKKLMDDAVDVVPYMYNDKGKTNDFGKEINAKQIAVLEAKKQILIKQYTDRFNQLDNDAKSFHDKKGAQVKSDDDNVDLTKTRYFYPANSPDTELRGKDVLDNIQGSKTTKFPTGGHAWTYRTLKLKEALAPQQAEIDKIDEFIRIKKKENGWDK